MSSTGQYTNTQLFSVATSVLSLSWGAARSFLIMRTKAEADPDPDMATVAVFIWPLTLVSGLKTEYSYLPLCFKKKMQKNRLS